MLQKTMIAILVLGSILLVIIHNIQGDNKVTSKISANRSAENSRRESITFIMGDDGDSDNRFYTEALNYYSQPGQTDHLIAFCRSLKEVKNYLIDFPPVCGQPWGRINIVVHSNEWGGLGAPVFPQGNRADQASILKAVKDGNFGNLPDSLMDSATEMILHACGLGRDTEILNSISIAFGGDDDQRPIVRSSKYFVLFESDQSNGRSYDTKRYLLDFRYGFFKTGYRPGDIRLSRRFKKRYGDSGIDYRDALSRTSPRFMGDAYHYNIRVPIRYIVTYPDGETLPVLEDEKAQEEWISEQEELQELFETYDIPAELFRWRFKKISYTHEDGTKEQGIKAMGDCTVVCILKAITDPTFVSQFQQNPLMPAYVDAKYYGWAGPGQ